jgi:hypothetical protein
MNGWNIWMIKNNQWKNPTWMMHEKCVNDGWLSNEWKLVDDLWMNVGWMSCIDMNVHSRMDDFHWYVIIIHWIMLACRIKGEFTQGGDHISKLGPMIYPSGRTYCNPIHTYLVDTND